MVVEDELHGDAATDDLLGSAGNLQSFFDQLGLEVAAAGGDEAAEEEIEWLSNKEAFPTVDTMEPGPAFVVPRTKVVRGRRRRRADEEVERLSNKDAFLEVEMAEPLPAVVTKVVRRRWRRTEEGLDGLPNKDAVPEVTRAVRRRRKRVDEEFYWFPNKDAFLEVDTAEPEAAVTKMVLRRRRAGASIAPTAAESGQMRRRREDEELESMPKSSKAALLEVETAEAQPRVKKKVVRVRRRLQRRAKEEPDWLPNKHTFLKMETAEPEPGLTKMVLRRRRAGASIAPTAAKPRQRRCSQCGRRKTPHWRAGPEGPRTLCNACGRRYKSELLVPEYQPLSSATFPSPAPAPELHSSMPRRIVEMCRSSATLVVPSALPTHHLSRSPPRTKEAVCKKSRNPFRGDLQASSDHAGLEVVAGRGGEEELEWPSNEDALPVLETMDPEPSSAVEPRVKEVVLQGRRAATPGHQWCQHCGSRKKPQWREGATEEEDEERDWLPNKNVPALETMELRPSVVVHQRRRAAASSHSQATAAELGQRRCSHCGTTETPQWREGPEGANTLCNACGMRHRSGRLVPEYRPLSSPKFSQSCTPTDTASSSRCAPPGIVRHRPARR